jgi:hypothetical protein
MRPKPQRRATESAYSGRYLPAVAVAVVALAGVAVVWLNAPWKTRATRPAEVSTVHKNSAKAPLTAGTEHSAVPVRLAQQPQPDTHHAAIEQLAEKANSRRDDWQTEIVSEAASAQLSQLSRWLEQPIVTNIDLPPSIVAVDFDCQSLRPKELREVYRDGVIQVRRAEQQKQLFNAPKLSGVDGFRRALAELHAALGSEGDRHVKFKLYRIEQDDANLNTLVRYEASLHGPVYSRQQTAVWNCRWTYQSEQGAASSEQGPRPLLTNIAVVRYEEAEVGKFGELEYAAGDGSSTLNSQHSTLFVDCTESALGNNASYRQQVLPGINHWLTRVSSEFLGKFGYNGLAVGDVNGDALDDLYVCDSGGLPNRLYVQQPDGTARDNSAAAGVDFLDDSTGALLVDLDNDGDQDLVVAMDPLLQFAENDGTGRFQLHQPLKLNTDSLSLCAADYDADGDLDVYVCGYNVREQDATNRGLPFPMPYHDANNGGRNVLFRNEGNFRFVDVTREAGLDENNTRFSMAAAWEDFDNDGDQDLYVANDFGRKNLYQNDNGHFTDIAADAGVEDTGSGMSVSWDDYNRDGLMDLYVGNMWSSAGNRVTYQPKFATGKADVTVDRIRRMAKGNTLFKNASRDGHTQFTDVSEEEAVEMGRWAWSSKFADLTNDGWPDLIVSNGFVSSTIPDDL